MRSQWFLFLKFSSWNVYRLLIESEIFIRWCKLSWIIRRITLFSCGYCRVSFRTLMIRLIQSCRTRILFNVNSWQYITLLASAFFCNTFQPSIDRCWQFLSWIWALLKPRRRLWFFKSTPCVFNWNDNDTLRIRNLGFKVDSHRELLRWRDDSIKIYFVWIRSLRLSYRRSICSIKVLARLQDWKHGDLLAAQEHHFS